jgi:HEAT repeat protein
MNQAYLAINQIGTNALPFLIKWLRCDHRTLREKTVAVRWRVEERLGIAHARDTIFTPFWLAQVASIAFGALGTNAAPAIPAVAQLMRDPSSSPVTVDAAASSLVEMGDKGFMEVIQFVRERGQSNRIHAIRSLASVRQNAGPALDVLMECLQDPDEQIAIESVKFFYIDTPEPEKRVAILVKGVADPRRSVRLASIESLRNYRWNASSLAELTRVLQDPDASIRQAASNALFEIAPEALTNRTRAF